MIKDGLGNTINLKDIVIHGDSIGMWAGYVVKLNKKSFEYIIVKRLGYDSQDFDAALTKPYGVRNFNRVVNISNTALANQIKQEPLFTKVINIWK